MDFRRRRPSPAARRWVEDQLGPGTRVTAWRRLTGGSSSAVHQLTVERRGHHRSVVLRRYEDADHRRWVDREAAALRRLRGTRLPAPEVLGADPAGDASGGHPALLMSRVPGRVDLAPRDVEGWLRQLARAAAAVHDLDPSGPVFEPWFDPVDRPVPESATDPGLWQSVYRILRDPPPECQPVFLHRDFQHFNVLWSRGCLRGVVDWVFASTGPPEIDAGHCRLNLAVLFSAERAERFRLAYEAEAGRQLDPWWDLHANASYDDRWLESIPEQVAGRIPVESARMTERVEDLLRASLRRLG